MHRNSHCDFDSWTLTEDSCFSSSSHSLTHHSAATNTIGGTMASGVAWMRRCLTATALNPNTASSNAPPDSRSASCPLFLVILENASRCDRCGPATSLLAPATYKKACQAPFPHAQAAVAWASVLFKAAWHASSFLPHQIKCPKVSAQRNARIHSVRFGYGNTIRVVGGEIARVLDGALKIGVCGRTWAGGGRSGV